MKATLMLVALSLSIAFAHNCVHDEVVKDHVLATNTLSIDKSAGFSPIRLKFLPQWSIGCTTTGSTTTYTASCLSTLVAYTCVASDFPSTQQTYIQSLLDAVKAKVEATFKIIPAASYTTVFSNCCRQSIPTPLTFSDNDLTIYVHFKPSTAATQTVSAGLVAFAVPCEKDQSNRPYLGFMNISPRHLSGDFDDDYSTVLHETLHVLGFTSSIFESFPSMIGHRVKSDTRTVTEFQSPNVVDFAKSFYNCPSATGVELDDFETSTTYPNHWEKANFYSEIMNPIRDENKSPLSNFTLAVFDDMGIYQTDRSQAEDFKPGQNAGCTWLNDACSSRASPYFCNAATNGCSYDRLAMATCNIRTYSGTFSTSETTSSTSIPTYFRYFGSTVIGGVDRANFCPQFQALSNGDCSETKNTDQFGFSDSFILQSYSNSARCFSSTATIASISLSSDPGMRCHNIECQSDGTLKLVFDSTHSAICPINGGVINLASAVTPTNVYKGSITCPPASELCSGVPVTAASVTPSPTPTRSRAAVTISPSATMSRGAGTPSTSPSRTRAAATPSASPSRTRAAATPSKSPSRTRAAATPSASPSRTRAAATPSTSPSRTRAAATPSASPSRTRAAATPSASPSRSRAAATPSRTASRTFTPTRSRSPSRSK